MRSNNVAPVSTYGRLYNLAWASALLAVFPAAWWLRPLILEDRIPLCIFRISTGMPCPLCGLTRAFAHGMHGNFGPAFQSNPLWLPAAVLIAVIAVLLVVDSLFGRDTFSRFRRRLDRLLIPTVIGLSIFGVWRLM